MSRVGNKPIPVPAGVTVKIEDSLVTVTGPQGELSREIVPSIHVRMEGDTVVLSRDSEEKAVKSLHGTMRSLIANMIEGVHKGYTKDLEIQGVGFRGQIQGQKIVLSLGYSHPIEYTAPDGVKMESKDGVKISISGADKQKVGQVSAQLRSYFPAEPYKGKGVRYKDEYVRRKAGKTVA